jgi:hypothetical protein
MRICRRTECSFADVLFSVQGYSTFHYNASRQDAASVAEAAAIAEPSRIVDAATFAEPTADANSDDFVGLWL